MTELQGTELWDLLDPMHAGGMQTDAPLEEKLAVVHKHLLQDIMHYSVEE